MVPVETMKAQFLMGQTQVHHQDYRLKHVRSYLELSYNLFKNDNEATNFKGVIYARELEIINKVQNLALQLSSVNNQPSKANEMF